MNYRILLFVDKTSWFVMLHCCFIYHFPPKKSCRIHVFLVRHKKCFWIDKVQLFWEGHKNLSHGLAGSLPSKSKIFVAFSEKLKNLKKGLTILISIHKRPRWLFYWVIFGLLKFPLILYQEFSMRQVSRNSYCYDKHLNTILIIKSTKIAQPTLKILCS